jgi:urease accessory protein
MLAAPERDQRSSVVSEANGGSTCSSAFIEWRSGRGVLVARKDRDRTVVVSARAESPLRLLRPTFPGTRSAATCIVTFGGGLVGGDDLELDVDVGAGATLLLFSQSSTKVYRGSARQTLRAKVDGTLLLLPDLVSAFCGARYTQRVEVSFGPEGACVLLDGFTAGRAAFGDRWAMTSLDLRTTIRTHDGRSVFADGLHFDVDDGPLADRAGRFDAFATLVAVGRRVEAVVDSIQREAVLPPSNELVVAASPLASADSLGIPGAIARIAASTTGGAMIAIRSRLRSLSDIDAVDPFASRY